MVLASIYLSVSTSLPSTPNIKPVEVWLFFSLAYPFLVIITNVVKQVREIIINLIFTNIIYITSQAYDTEHKNYNITPIKRVNPKRVNPKMYPEKQVSWNCWKRETMISQCFKILTFYINPSLYVLLSFVYVFVYVIWWILIQGNVQSIKCRYLIYWARQGRCSGRFYLFTSENYFITFLSQFFFLSDSHSFLNML